MVIRRVRVLFLAHVTRLGIYRVLGVAAERCISIVRGRRPRPALACVFGAALFLWLRPEAAVQQRSSEPWLEQLERVS